MLGTVRPSAITGPLHLRKVGSGAASRSQREG